MALVLFGNGVADIRGSINGTTFARNKSGAYARNRTTPVNPNTVLQSSNRVRFGQQAAKWTALTNAQQDSWIALAAGATRLNRLGQAYTPSGRQLFLESANNMSIIGQPALTTAPINSDVPAGPLADELTYELTAGVPTTVTVAGDTGVSAFYAIIKATPPNPGPKTNFSNLYRVVFTGITAASYDFESGYGGVFGPTPGEIGSPISVLVSHMDSATGFRSAELRLDAVITGT